MSDPYAIVTEHLSKRYRRTWAVQNLDFHVPTGQVTALLGPNGAGKSTTLKVLVNLLPPTSGAATVLGVNSRKLRPKHFQDIGYVSENQPLPLWMTIRQYFDYLRPFYPRWDEDFRQKLTGLLDLDIAKPLKQCSRGMQMKAALLGATAFRPRLLILDEPFTGLDPLAREQFLQGMLELTQDEGWTILLSSHDMEEVERVADQIAFLSESQLLIAEPAETLLHRFRRVEVTRPPGAAKPGSLPASWLNYREGRGMATLVESQYDEQESLPRFRDLLQAAPDQVQFSRMTLREIFIALASNSKPADA